MEKDAMGGRGPDKSQPINFSRKNPIRARSSIWKIASRRGQRGAALSGDGFRPDDPPKSNL